MTTFERVLWLLLANAAVFISSYTLSRELESKNEATKVVILLVIRILMISGIILLGGVTHLLSPVGIGLIAVATLVIVTVFLRRFEYPRITFPKVPIILALPCCVIALRLILQIWFFAPNNYDAVSYHLTKIAEWIQAGGFTREMGVDTHAPFPAGFELVETWWAVFLRHDLLIEAAGVEFITLAFAGTWSLATHLGLPAKWGGFSALLYVMTPGLHLQATSCLNDGAVAALIVAGMALISQGTRWGIIVALIGLGIGIKPTFVYALPGLMLLTWLLRKRRDQLLLSRWSIAIGVLGIAIGAFWYVRNTAWYGSPIYPVGTQGLIAETGEMKIQFGPSFENAVKNVVSLFQSRIYDNEFAYVPLLNDISGWGNIAFACGAVTLIYAARIDKPIRLLALCFVVSFASILFLVNHDPWNLRFVLFFPALLSIAVAKFAENHRSLMVVVIPALLVQFLATMVPGDLPWENVKGLASFSWEGRTYAKLINAYPDTDSIAYFGQEPVHNRGESYLMYGPDFARRVTYLRAQTPRELVAEMKAADTRLVYVSRVAMNEPNLVDRCVEHRLLRWMGGRYYLLQESPP